MLLALLGYACRVLLRVSALVQMHMTCTGITRDTAEDLLAEAAQAGIRSILVLRGDPLPSSKGKWEATAEGFAHAGELVEHIRRKHGSFFSIAVAGHPLGKHVSHIYLLGFAGLPALNSSPQTLHAAVFMATCMDMPLVSRWVALSCLVSFLGQKSSLFGLLCIK